MTDLERIDAIALAILHAGWAARMLAGIDGDKALWFGDASDCAPEGPETMVDTEVHADQLSAWRELGTEVLPHLEGAYATRLRVALGREA